MNKLFKCNIVEDYTKLVEFMVGLDQPCYVFKSDDNDKLFLVSDKDIENVDEVIDNLKTEIDKSKTSLSILDGTDLEGFTEDDLDDLSELSLF